MDRKWAWGIVATLLTLWISALTREVIAQGKELAVASELLPRIEKKVDAILDRMP